jgi:hypothetical protein
LVLGAEVEGLVLLFLKLFESQNFWIFLREVPILLFRALLSFDFIQIRHHRFPVNRYRSSLRWTYLWLFLFRFQILVESANRTIVHCVIKEIRFHIVISCFDV